MPVLAKFPFRQGLWTADLRTPPEQECSNGSLIHFAVVLWRTFFNCRAFLGNAIVIEGPASDTDALQVNEIA